MNFKNTLSIMLGVVMLSGSVYLMFKESPPEPIARPPFCAEMDASKVRNKVLVRSEGKYGERVYVNREWANLLTATKEEFGHYLALCESNGKWVEVRDAESGEPIRKYEITLAYKMEHGLPIER